MVKLNKKAQTTILFALMIGIVCYILGMALAPSIFQANDEATHSEQLNCSNSSMTTIQKSVCTQQDMFLPLWVGLCFGLAGIALSWMATS